MTWTVTLLAEGDTKWRAIANLRKTVSDYAGVSNYSFRTRPFVFARHGGNKVTASAIVSFEKRQPPPSNWHVNSTSNEAEDCSITLYKPMSVWRLLAGALWYFKARLGW